ncbi:MAG: zf-HC2 domain-containing protein [Planctomycetota bacterium]
MPLFKHDTCRRVRALLPLHAGSDLTPQQARLVDEHLHQCLSCFREHRDFVGMRERLGILAEEKLPEGALDGFAEEVMARISLGESGPRAPAPGRLRRLSLPPAPLLRRVAAAAALLLALGLGWREWGGSGEVRPKDLAGDMPPIADSTERSSTERSSPREPPSDRALAGQLVGAGNAREALRDQRSGVMSSGVLDLPLGVDQRFLLEARGAGFGPFEPGTGLLIPEPDRELRLRDPSGSR